MSDNVFGRSRRRLTMFYACVMFAFLASLTFLMHAAMEWSLTSEQTRELMETAAGIAEPQDRGAYSELVLDESTLYKNSGVRLFYYVFDHNGKLVNFSRASYRMEPFILDIISGWSLSEGKSAVYSKMDEKGEMIKIMIVSRKIHSSMSRSDEYEQIAYIGKDVTAMYNGMQKATYALILLGVLAIIVASVAGYLMSGKAFVPLKQAYEKQRQFAADASHELRTPLAVVMASAEILASDPSIKSPFLKQVIEDVHDEVKKMTKLVSDLLVVARSDNNQLRLKLSKFDMSALIDQTMRQMQPLAEKKKITIIALPSTKTMLRADEQKIKQLMTILVDNAIKYTPEKGIVTMFLEKHDRSRLIFGVMDTGIGIAAEDQAKIFDRFFRVDKVRSREMGGNGLGLAIAREIVGLHKGKITVQSKPGDGTKFIIELNDNLKGKTVQAPIAESDALGIAD